MEIGTGCVFERFRGVFARFRGIFVLGAGIRIVFFENCPSRNLFPPLDRKGTHISNYAVWRFIEDGKEADSVQRQINRRTLSIKMTDNGIGRHFVQCVTRSCEERMISLKIPKLFLALAKSSKAPFVPDNINFVLLKNEL